MNGARRRLCLDNLLSENSSPAVGTMVFVQNFERLGLQPERIMSIHSLNPDRLPTMAEIRAALGRK